MGKRHTLKGLVVTEISLVDAPANPGAVHLLYKRKGPAMPTEAEAAAAAAAAKKATGNTLDRLLTRLGIIKRAAEPGAVDPDTYADAASAAVDKGCEALTASIASIMADAAVTDKGAAITKSLAEFRSFTAEATTAQLEKAMRDVALATGVTKTAEDNTMPTPAEQQAQIDTLTKQVADLAQELTISKMSAKHSAHMASLSSDAAKSAFAAKSPADREAACTAADTAKAAAESLAAGPQGVALTKALGEIDILKGVVATFTAERELSDFRKRAVEAGVGEGSADILLKASKGDPDAFGKMLAMLKSSTEAARTGVIFKEFGASGGNGDKAGAAGEVEAAAAVLMKADPKLSAIQARVAVRKANQELAQRERDEERAATRAA